MQIQSALVSLALVAGTASAYEHVYTNGTYTITKVWDAVTTYCPSPPPSASTTAPTPLSSPPPSSSPTAPAPRPT